MGQESDLPYQSRQLRHGQSSSAVERHCAQPPFCITENGPVMNIMTATSLKITLTLHPMPHVPTGLREEKS